ncbi:hypothetical protein MmiAt1_06400 [Methanimicrococcus sp. At1]|uniref:Uncharacterized protein n=1 Tax=Methanimicrococcus hacksteinii TaxID=3028293 RepID=A0ABU3VNU3_9EURY|nr:hypothetical protein [Methanimicrococcus sp. At1]MDV0445084.1 hypothetical protein [Methanimicrococcus sp. At1]
MSLESSKYSENPAFSIVSGLSDPADIREVMKIGNPVLNELTFCQLKSFGSESVLELKIPLELELDFENGLYIAKNETFGLFSFGKDLKETIHFLEVQFELLWKVYVLENDLELTAGGKELQNRLKKYISKK